MAYNTDDLTTIERAIASGQLRVRLADGSEMQYQSTEQLIKVRSLIANALGAGTASPTIRRIRIYSTKDC
jgi:hypothetical protein